jgi:hypothetical protein
MSVQCFEDTCSVKWNTIITGSGPAYQASLELADTGSIVCTEGSSTADVGGPGLYVDLLDNTAAAVSAGRECANILRRTAGGKLHALIPNSLITTVTPANLRSIPNTGAASGTSQTTVITNTTGCAALLILRGQFQVNWEVNDTVGAAAPAAGVPYSALLKMSLLFNGTPVDVQYGSYGGTKKNAVNVVQYMKDWRDISYMQAMTAGQSITITDEVIHDLTDIGIRQNWTANVATTPPNFQTGYRVVLTADILPIGAI